MILLFFFFKQKTAYEMRISDWSSDVCSSDLALAANTPDFQADLGYDQSAPGQANLSMSTTQLAERFGAVSMTLEMPFKANRDLPAPVPGWAPERPKLPPPACSQTLPPPPLFTRRPRSDSSRKISPPPPP